MRLVLIAWMLAIVMPAQAAPVVWTLTDVTLTDGGFATGQFSYDADTGVYSDLAINTYAPSGVLAAAYDLVDRGGGRNQIFRSDGVAVSGVSNGDNSVAQISIFWDQHMTNAGGDISIIGGLEETTFHTPYFRSYASGFISAVPVPAAVWLFGSALVGLGWFRRDLASSRSRRDG